MSIVGRPRPGDVAWALIVAYEIGCPSGELLCESFDRRITRHPILTRLVIFYTSLHVANMLPTRFDLIYQVAVLFHRAVQRLGYPGELGKP